jgi:hypothetical protein
MLSESEKQKIRAEIEYRVMVEQELSAPPKRPWVKTMSTFFAHTFMVTDASRKAQARPHGQGCAPKMVAGRLPGKPNPVRPGRAFVLRLAIFPVL